MCYSGQNDRFAKVSLPKKLKIANFNNFNAMDDGIIINIYFLNIIVVVSRLSPESIFCDFCIKKIDIKFL